MDHRVEQVFDVACNVTNMDFAWDNWQPSFLQSGVGVIVVAEWQRISRVLAGGRVTKISPKFRGSSYIVRPYGARLSPCLFFLFRVLLHCIVG